MTNEEAVSVTEQLKKIAEFMEELRALGVADDGPLTDEAFAKVAAECEYIAIKRFPDGTCAAVTRFIFTYAIVSEVTRYGYGRRWCYSDRMACLEAFEEWADVKGHPQGWHRAVHTGERRDEQGNFLGVW